MVGSLTASEEAQLSQTIEMFEVITQSQPQDYQSLEILKEAYYKLGREQDVIRTSKRIAEAYVLMGQLSSAILEYESILQRYPEDPDVLAALGELENKANTLNAPSGDNTEILRASPTKETRRKSADAVPAPTEVEDGRPQMHKLFVDSKVIAPIDFESYWPKHDLSKPPPGIVEPFIQTLADKGILPIEKAIKTMADKQRLAYLPLERYELDVELIRSCPSATLQRWCVLPFDHMSKSVLVATANPFNKQAAAELERALKQRLLWYLAPPADIIKALRRVVR
jgi:tetratricopeptide (TPR) repeat protein